MRVDKVTRRSGRLFTFGCSMTKYHYPTWADILGKDWRHHENWGKPAAGNSYIFNSIMECLSRNKLTADDTVLILWSSISRIDGYQYNDWTHHHSLFADDSEFANCPRGYEIQSYAWISAIDLILDQLPCQYYPMTWVDYDLDDTPGKVFASAISKIKKIPFSANRRSNIFSDMQSFQQYWKELYQRLSGPDWPSLEKIYNNDLDDVSAEIKIEIKEFWELISRDKRWKLKTKQIDSHPSPNQHLEMIENVFSDLSITDSTRTWVRAQDLAWFSGKYLGFNQSLPKERL